MLTRLFDRGLLRIGGSSSVLNLVQARFNAVVGSPPGGQEKGKKTRRKKQHRVMKEGPHNTGIHQLCALSPELTTIVGVPKASRVDVNKKLWVYIKSHNLQETTDKRNIKPDAVLGKKLTLVAEIEPIG
ncbi:Upstream activation factor subunit UAF30, putative [Perkinsus marinus ATCC 50983]|uniref:Upstream activation factor subunit UAF30, putative n=1 Tax=Perkinsus marinus (strain ATCC 50983 / TXsc) TaxID=423536 RepID=C5KPZ5_PERM5|nr:Upstream activation factor subunit UAF30, putative [Perkinsus marinus ATCC 50983]EER13542.1 Upstream activation factor subunit UAF30, putative [Perkinsus marinus ATCC 50983]|eukprot:XP_002781747.1 Upstream activation factor subunit UAF30, putative [Perkinsus marinus ATCC 50983]